MKTEKIKDCEDTEKKSTSARIGRSVLSVINPSSDLKIIYRLGIKPIYEKFRTLSVFSKSESSKRELLTFEQAVQASGRTVEQLKKIYFRRQLFWWLPMALSMIFSMMIVVFSFIASDLPVITLIRGISWAIVLASLSIFCLVSSVKAAYRRWQLANEKVSIEEGGTFSDFMQEDNQILKVILLRFSFKKGKKS